MFLVLRKIWFLLALGVSSLSLAGPKVNNGGNVDVQELKSYFFPFLEHLKANAHLQTSLTKEQIMALEETFLNARVNVTDTRPKDQYGDPVDAISQPDPQRPPYKVITFYEPKLRELLRTPFEKVKAVRFVLHEYLIAAGINDENYVLSIPLAQSLAKVGSSGTSSAVYSKIKSYLPAGECLAVESNMVDFQHQNYPVLKISKNELYEERPNITVCDAPYLLNSWDYIGYGSIEQAMNCYNSVDIELTRDFDAEGRIFFKGAHQSKYGFTFRVEIYSTYDKLDLRFFAPNQVGNSENLGQRYRTCNLKNLSKQIDQSTETAATKSFWKALNAGDLIKVKRILSTDSTINLEAKDEVGRTALAQASRNYMLASGMQKSAFAEILKVLLEKSVNVNAVDLEQKIAIDYLAPKTNYTYFSHPQVIDHFLGKISELDALRAKNLAVTAVNMGHYTAAKWALNYVSTQEDLNEIAGQHQFYFFDRSKSYDSSFAQALLDLKDTYGVDGYSIKIAFLGNLKERLQKYLSQIDSNTIDRSFSFFSWVNKETFVNGDLVREILKHTSKDFNLTAVLGNFLNPSDNPVFSLEIARFANFDVGAQTYNYPDTILLLSLLTCRGNLIDEILIKGTKGLLQPRTNSQVSAMQFVALNCSPEKIAEVTNVLLKYGQTFNDGKGDFTFQQDDHNDASIMYYAPYLHSNGLTGIRDILFYRIESLSSHFTSQPSSKMRDLRILAQLYRHVKNNGGTGREQESETARNYIDKLLDANP